MEVCRLVSDGRFRGHHRPQTDQRTAFVPDGRLPAPLGISRRRRQAPGTGRFRVAGPGATADLRRRMEGRSLRSPRHARTQPAQSARRIRGRRNAPLPLPRGLRPGHQGHDSAVGQTVGRRRSGGCRFASGMQTLSRRTSFALLFTRTAALVPGGAAQRRPMNIKEVAKLAKVSTATVSRTINGSDKVSARTAERVQKAIKELNFYPNTHARTLVSGRSRMLGLIISDITNPFFPELVKHFEDQAVQKGLEVIIAN